MSVVVVDNDGAVAVVETFVALFTAEHANLLCLVAVAVAAIAAVAAVVIGRSRRLFRFVIDHIAALFQLLLRVTRAGQL